MLWVEETWKLYIEICVLFGKVEFVAKTERCGSRLIVRHMIELITAMIDEKVLELFFEGKSWRFAEGVEHFGLGLIGRTVAYFCTVGYSH